MSLYKPMVVSLLPERINDVDKRAKDLGLSRAKYIQALVEIDIKGELLDCTADAEDINSRIHVRKGVCVAVLDQEQENAKQADIIINTLRTLKKASPAFEQLLSEMPLRRAANEAVKLRT